MDVTVENPSGVLPEDDLSVRLRVLAWLRGNLPAHPFDGLKELEAVDVPAQVVPPGKGHVLDRLFPPDDALNPLGIRVDLSLIHI